LTHPEGYGRQLPKGCRRLVFLNKLESPDHYKLAREIVGFIAEESRNFGTYGPGCWVVLGSIHGIPQGADPVSQVVKLGGSGE
ncbi:MAG TPA: hypothetical protein VHS59_11890, partial [Bacillota bacterium]|nr:hypothetical protein [Bacillota bacterium]